MKKLYSGKTKDVFWQADGSVLLVFKDDVTGTAGTIDPGGNEVVAQIEGKGASSAALSSHFFDLLAKAGLVTHYIGAGPEPGTLVVHQARSFELEIICREKAYGSFVRRYGKWIETGAPLPTVVEFTLKDDERGDPLINDEALAALGLLTRDEIESIKQTARQATGIIKADLARHGLELLDIKFEFGEVDGRIAIIDEISGDTMRVIKDGRVLQPAEVKLADI